MTRKTEHISICITHYHHLTSPHPIPPHHHMPRTARRKSSQGIFCADLILQINLAETRSPGNHITNSSVAERSRVAVSNQADAEWCFLLSGVEAS